MSNQVFSNETDIYPIFQTAEYIKGGNLLTDKYIKVSTDNPQNSDVLKIIDSSPAGTLEDPILASFGQNQLAYRDNASLGLPPVAKTLVMTNDFGPLPDGQFLIQTDWEFTQGVVGAVEAFNIEIEYVWDSSSVVAVINKDQCVVGRATYDTTYNIGTILDVPVGGSTINRINVYFDSSGTNATGTKTKGYMLLTPLP